YERATRLPSAYEVFGNGVLIKSNLELEPEVSHNLNIGPRLELRRSPVGTITVDVNLFYRNSDKLITPITSERFVTYQNVFGARTVGLENAVAWDLPGKWLTL